MSSSSDDLALKLEWYEIRDLLFGHNDKKQDVMRALELASICRHPDAKWLTGVCAGRDVKTWEEARDVFLAQGSNDARALCFAALVDEDNVDLPRLRRSAELGFAFAQARMFSAAGVLEGFTFASLAAAQGDRDGFFYLGVCYQSAYGCERDLEKAIKSYLLAARDMSEPCADMAVCLMRLTRSGGTGGVLLRPEEMVGIFWSFFQVLSIDSSLILLSLLSCL